jgi:uncharacterized membrane protein YgdD (TMEM256/DUF423 family)
MSPTIRFFACFAAAALGTAAMLGAYATHALEGTLDAARLRAFTTAIEYQFYHALGLLAVALLAERFPSERLLVIAGWLLAAGIVLFSGSIYATTAGVPGVATAAPIGGFSLIAGWLTLLAAAWRLPRARRGEPT